MLAGEVTPVLKALRKNGLDVVAIHHHMTDTQPTIFFLHYWGTGPAEKLATGFKAAARRAREVHGRAPETVAEGARTSPRNNDGGPDSRRDQPAAIAAGWMF